ncbi:MAG: O-antigen ligase family protein [Proteobacteria bacterium]|nr:O-antigen ligase family protein [Pseudomonadota bacterium]
MIYKKIFNVNTLKQTAFNDWSHIVLLGSILLYAFTRFIDPVASQIAQGVLVFYMAYFFVKNPDQIRRDPMYLLFIGVIISQIATWGSVEMFHPEIQDNTLKIDKLGKLFLFIPIAWGLQRKPKWVPIVLLTACVGFTADLLFGCDFFAQVALAIQGQRVDFGVRNAQHTSMVFGLMVIISIFYMAVADKKTKMGIAFLFFTMGLAGLTVTQTRQTFFGIIVAVGFVFILSCFLTKLNLKKIMISVVMMAVLFGTASYSITINHRQNEAWDTIKTFTDPMPENLQTAGKKEILAYYISKQKDSGSGLRVKLWLGMLPYVYQNPFLGWGSNSIEGLIKNNPYFINEKSVTNMGHLHNFHITLYICCGIIGVLLINGIYVWLLLSSFRDRKQIPHGDQWFLLSVGFVTYWQVINCFENFSGFWTGVFCHNLILGCIYAHYFSNKKVLNVYSLMKW